MEEASGMDSSGRRQDHDGATWDEVEERSHGSSEGGAVVTSGAGTMQNGHGKTDGSGVWRTRSRLHG